MSTVETESAAPAGGDPPTTVRFDWMIADSRCRVVFVTDNGKCMDLPNALACSLVYGI